jgi:hypothetical protein
MCHGADSLTPRQTKPVHTRIIQHVLQDACKEYSILRRKGDVWSYKISHRKPVLERVPTIGHPAQVFLKCCTLLWWLFVKTIVHCFPRRLSWYPWRYTAQKSPTAFCLFSHVYVVGFCYNFSTLFLAGCEVYNMYVQLMFFIQRLQILRGLPHEIFRSLFWPVCMHQGLSVNRFWFFNFNNAPFDFRWLFSVLVYFRSNLLWDS